MERGWVPQVPADCASARGACSQRDGVPGEGRVSRLLGRCRAPPRRFPLQGFLLRLPEAAPETRSLGSLPGGSGRHTEEAM